MAWLVGLLATKMSATAAKLVAWLIVLGLIGASVWMFYGTAHHKGYEEGKEAMQPAIAAAKADAAKEKELRIVAEKSTKSLLAALKQQNKDIEDWHGKAKAAQDRANKAVAALEEATRAQNAAKARLVTRLKKVLDAPDLPTMEACAEAAALFDELAETRGVK